METFDGDPTLFTRPNAGDESLFVVFYKGVLKNEAKSVEEGRPIFDEVDCVRVIIPGDKNHIVDRPASLQDKQRFSKQFDMFKAGLSEEEQVTGTRLNEWPLMSRSQCEEFKFFGIKTVEHLADVRDDIVARVPGMRDLRTAAKVWLAKASSTAEAAKTAKALEEQNSEIGNLKQVVAEQAARIEMLLAKAKA